MKKTNLFLIPALCGIALLTAGCATCPTGVHHQHHEQRYKTHEKYKHKKQDKPIVFQQTYDTSDIHNVKANIYTRSSRGGQSEMGIIQFKETDNGLKMVVDLIDLRPGKVYTAQIYQCEACNNSVCCDTEAMAIDLPQIQTKASGHLQESYIIRGLTATQLNNAKLFLTRDGGYKAAWGTLNQ